MRLQTDHWPLDLIGRQSEQVSGLRGHADLTSRMRDETAAGIRAGLRDNQTKPHEGPVLHGTGFWGALLMALRVTGAAFPTDPSFLPAGSDPRAMRLSNAAAVGMLFAIGWRPDPRMQDVWRRIHWLFPLAGMALLAVTIALGGWD